MCAADIRRTKPRCRVVTPKGGASLHMDSNIYFGEERRQSPKMVLDSMYRSNGSSRLAPSQGVFVQYLVDE